MITEQQYKDANAAGLRHKASGDLWSYYTPSLQVAYNLGLNGVNLQDAEIATCFRYGKAPECFVSWNYAENTSENGLSVYTEKSVVRSEFLDRKRYDYTGLVAGKGSDDETLILCFEAEYLD